MGYEMKFYIGLKFKNTKGYANPNYNFFQKVAMFDYCNDNDLADFIDTFENSNVYGYFTQENVEEITDKYGKEFKAIPIEALIDYLETTPDDYRRYKPFLALLKAFNEEKEKFESDITELMVIRYGY